MKTRNGFIYIWRDKKRKRFYIGSHWGREDDGYICSSTWMKNTYKRRPQDFKRRIIQRCENVTYSELLDAEHKWLSLILKEELGKKFYNMQNHRPGHWASTDRAAEIAESTAQKNRGRKGKPCSPEKARKISEVKKQKFKERREETGSAFSEEHLQKMSESRKGVPLSETHRVNIAKGLRNQSEEHRRKRAEAKRGSTLSAEARAKVSVAMKGKPKSDEHRAKISEQMRARKGVPKSEAWKEKMASRVWITDGVSNKRISKELEVPEGWRLGRTKAQ